MFKPVSRVVFSMAIALVLVAGIYTSVLGATLGAGAKSGQAHLLAVSHFRSASQVQTPFQFSGHNCDSDTAVDPSDY